MGFRVGTGTDVPDGPDVAAIRATHATRVISVVFTLAEQKNVFVAARRPVLHAFGLTIGLVPNNVGAQIPTFLLKCERQEPRYTDQVLGLQSVGSRGPDTHCPHGILFVGSAPSAASRSVGVADIEPERTVIS